MGDAAERYVKDCTVAGKLLRFQTSTFRETKRVRCSPAPARFSGLTRFVFEARRGFRSARLDFDGLPSRTGERWASPA